MLMNYSKLASKLRTKIAKFSGYVSSKRMLNYIKNSIENRGYGSMFY